MVKISKNSLKNNDKNLLCYTYPILISAVLKCQIAGALCIPLTVNGLDHLLQVGLVGFVGGDVVVLLREGEKETINYQCSNSKNR